MVEKNERQAIQRYFLAMALACGVAVSLVNSLETLLVIRVPQQKGACTDSIREDKSETGCINCQVYCSAFLNRNAKCRWTYNDFEKDNFGIWWELGLLSFLSVSFFFLLKRIVAKKAPWFVREVYANENSLDGYFSELIFVLIVVFVIYCTVNNVLNSRLVLSYFRELNVSRGTLISNEINARCGPATDPKVIWITPWTWK